MPPPDVRVELIDADSPYGMPYRGVITDRPTLRLIVSIATARDPRASVRWLAPFRGPFASVRWLAPSRAPRHVSAPPREVTLDVDDASIEVCDQRGGFTITAIDQLFVAERQPPAWRFLTWFGVFVRRRGDPDRLLLETPDGRVARFVERTIEERLGLRDEPVRGELRLAL